MVLALWATAVPTGTGLQRCMIAVAALHEQLAGIRCPAPADAIDGAQMTEQKPQAVLNLKGIVILIQVWWL